MSVQSLRDVVDNSRQRDLSSFTSQRELAPESPPQCRQSRYGMRNVRIGEASHPGPFPSRGRVFGPVSAGLGEWTRRRVRRRVVDTDSDTPMEDVRTDGEESGAGPRK